MLYSFGRQLVTLMLWVFYRKIYISNAHRIPKNKPVLLAANHPTGFIEPCIIACYLEQPLHFLVRGDMFVKPFYIRLMRSIHLLPLYRAKDRGLAFVKTNYETFEYCYQALNEKKTVLILAEGSAEHEKRLRSLKKGASRIAFGTLEKFPDLEDVYIVPVGVNYEYADQPRSRVMIDFGEPISARQFWERYQQNAASTSAEFTETLRQQMAERIVIIEKEEDEELTEYLLRLDRSQRPANFPKHAKTPLEAEKRVADTVNKMDAAAKNTLLSLVKSYFNHLQQLRITDRALMQQYNLPILNYVLLLLGLPFFLIGYLFNVPPVLLAKYIAKTRVKRIVFYASVWLAAALGAYFAYWLLWLIVLLIFTKPIYWLLLLVIPLLGVFAIRYKEFYKEKMEIARVKGLNRNQKENLLQQRQAIIDLFTIFR